MQSSAESEVVSLSTIMEKASEMAASDNAALDALHLKAGLDATKHNVYLVKVRDEHYDDSEARRGPTSQSIATLSKVRDETIAEV